jgi:hypothetical protein
MRNLLVAGALVAALGLYACNHKAPISPTPPPWLPTAVQEQVTQQAPDATLVGSLYPGLADGDTKKTDWKVTLDVGKCYWISAAGDQGIEEIALYLFDPSDHRVAKEPGRSPRTLMNYCPEVSGLFRLQAKVTEGRGHYAVGVYAKDAAKSGATPPPPTAAPTAAPAAGQDLGAVADKESKSAAAGATRVGEFFKGNADETDWYTQLDQNKCYWFLGVGSAEIKELWLFLWDPDEKRITVNKSETNKVVVGHCPTKTGMYHFQAKVGSGSGSYVVGLYAKDKEAKK